MASVKTMGLLDELAKLLNPPPSRHRVGYWRGARDSILDSSLPWPESVEWDEREKRAVLSYLRAGRVAEQWMGWSDCRICGCHNGSADLTDGTYTWPEGLAHYVDAHSVGLPAEFVAHALRKT